MNNNQENGVIYVITNMINNKKYVGLTTKNIEIRFQEHKFDSNKTKCKYAIHHAMKKHGIDNFIITILEKCESYYNLRKSEIKWIEKLNTFIEFGNGYNMTHGGDGILGCKLSSEHKQKISNSNKGRIFSKKHCQNIRLSKIGYKNPMYGKHISNEHKKIIGKFSKNRKFSLEHRQKISKSLLGKKCLTKQKTCKKINQINLLTNEIIVHNSIQDAARSISNKASPSNILYACKGIRKQAYGFTWQFTNDT